MEQNVIRSFNPNCLRQDCHFVHSCLAKDEPCMYLSEQEKADMREIEMRNKPPVKTGGLFAKIEGRRVI